MTPSKPIETWKVNMKIGWLIRPDFINDAIDKGLIEIIEDRWIVHAINATMIVKNGDYIVHYEEGIAVYTKTFVDAAYEIFNIFKE